MQMKRADRSATIFSRVSAAPPPLIMQPAGSISSAPSMYTSSASTSVASSTAMPAARRRALLWSELDTAARIRTGMRARASMKQLTVVPVPTPMMASGGT